MDKKGKAAYTYRCFAGARARYDKCRPPEMTYGFRLTIA